MLMVSFLVSVYYNVIIAWVLFYLFASFRPDVPWRDCDPAWASKYCLKGARPSGLCLLLFILLANKIFATNIFVKLFELLN